MIDFADRFGTSFDGSRAMIQASREYAKAETHEAKERVIWRFMLALWEDTTPPKAIEQPDENSVKTTNATKARKAIGTAKQNRVLLAAINLRRTGRYSLDSAATELASSKYRPSLGSRAQIRRVLAVFFTSKTWKNPSAEFNWKGYPTSFGKLDD